MGENQVDLKKKFRGQLNSDITLFNLLNKLLPMANQ